MELDQVVKDLEHLLGASRRQHAEDASAREREVLDLVALLRGPDATQMAPTNGPVPDSEYVLAPASADPDSEPAWTVDHTVSALPAADEPPADDDAPQPTE